MLARPRGKYIVAAHTVRTKFEIMRRSNNRVTLNDAGMLKESFGGRASALEIQDGRFTAYCSDGDLQLLRAPDAQMLAVAPHNKGKGELRP